MSIPQKIRWIAFILPIMLMSAPAFAIKPKGKASEIIGIIPVDVMLSTMAEHWFTTGLIVMVVICFIMILRLAGSRQVINGIGYKQAVAISMYSSGRVRKMTLLAGRSTTELKNALTTAENLRNKLARLNGELKSFGNSEASSIANNPTIASSRSSRLASSDADITLLGDESFAIAKQEEIRIAQEEYDSFTRENGSPEAILTLIAELKKIDNMITHCWKIMERIEGFNPDDFRFPGD